MKLIILTAIASLLFIFFVRLPSDEEICNKIAKIYIETSDKKALKYFIEDFNCIRLYL